jgi:hypothetical protein
MKIKFELIGESLDISDVLQVLGTYPTITAEELGSKSYFCIEIKSKDEIPALRENMNDHLKTLNGIARYLYGNHKPVKLGNASIDHGNNIIDAIVVAEYLEGRSRMYGDLQDASGNSTPSKTPYELSVSDLTLSLVFKMIENEGYSWVNLYRIYEIIDEKVGDAKIKGYGVTAPEIKLFTHTANNTKTIGINSRHGHSAWDPPPVPMSQADATILIKKIISGYIESLKI